MLLEPVTATAKPSLVPDSSPSSSTLWGIQQAQGDVVYLLVKDAKNETRRQKHSLRDSAIVYFISVLHIYNNLDNKSFLSGVWGNNMNLC